jgi:hypothetical protein
VWFISGFRKIAAYGASTLSGDSGQGFKVVDTEPTPYVAGVGGMSPSGIPSYKPTETGKVPWQPLRSAKAAEKQRALDIAMLSKMSSQGDPRDPTAYVGSAGQGADTLVSQLKYESGYNNITEGMGYNKVKHRDSPYLKRLKKARKEDE